MAIKEGGNKFIGVHTITKSCLAIADRGVVACYSVAGSGAGIGVTAGAVDVFAAGSGNKPAGILLVDVVDVNQTRYHVNYYKEIMTSGSPVPLLLQGRLTVNGITGTPTEGAPAYMGAAGGYTTTLSATGGLAATPRVGTFDSIKDADGFATIEFNLPY